MEDLSPRQRDVADFICYSLAQRGIAPTYREIGDALGIASTNGVADHVKALIRKGYVKKARGSSGGVARGIQLTNKARRLRRGEVVEIPLVAKRGPPGMLHIDRRLLPPGEAICYEISAREYCVARPLQEGEARVEGAFYVWRSSADGYYASKDPHQDSALVGKVLLALTCTSTR